MGGHSNPTNVYSEIETVTADSTGMFTGFSMGYLYGTNADYGLDSLAPVTGTPLSRSQDGEVRSVFYDSGIYRTIGSSTFFSALADGQNNNTKANVMMQYLSFLMGEPRPNITASTEELDFGITYPDLVYNKELEISNTGLDTLFVTDISISGDGFLYSGITEFMLEPNETHIIEISFFSDQVGQYPGELTIISNDPDTPELMIPMFSECVIPPSIVCDPSFIELELASNAPYHELLSISNSGGYQLICELAIGDSTQNISWLDIVQDSCIVEPGEEYNIIVIFDPDTLENGQYQTEISIIHNDPDQDVIYIPITLSLNITDAADDPTVAATKLIGNYPNPFNPTTTISFTTTEITENTELVIYNLKGQEIKDLSPSLHSLSSRAESRDEGRGEKQYSVVWNGRDDNNKLVSSGIYFYKLKTANFEKSKKMILLK